MENMEKAVIQASLRTVTGKQVQALRREGKLPAVLYGHNFEPKPITLDLRTASRILHSVTASSLVTIDLEGKEHAALVRDRQRDFIKGHLLHVDFQVVSMTEALRAFVGVEHVGASPAVKDLDGILITGLTEIEVECLPQDLPERVVIDFSNLKHIGDTIHVRDIQLGDKVRILTDPEELLVIVTFTGPATVEAEAVEEVAAGEPEVIERGKKLEEKEPAE